MLLHYALSSQYEVFDKNTHLRDDIFVSSLVIEHDNNVEGYYPKALLTIENPRTTLDDLWLHISCRGKILFSGQISPVPRGFVDELIDIEVIAKGPLADTQLAALIESAKVAPGYDPLFVPEGDENDPAEVLSGDGRAVAWSRKLEEPVLADLLSGSRTLMIIPNRGSLRVTPAELVPSAIEYTLTVEWKQLVQEFHNLSSRIGTFKTLTSQSVESNWPKVGSKIGTFDVVSSSLRENERERKELTATEATPLGDLAFDPAWAAGGAVPLTAEVREYAPQLTLENKFEVKRTESAIVRVSSNIQSVFRSDEVEQEEIPLNDITERSTADEWKANFEYLEGDEVVDGGFVYKAREDHTSGTDRDVALWSKVAEISYLSSRRISSFFKTKRGEAAILHAIERAKARLRYAARSVIVRCEMKLPSVLDALGHDTIAIIVHPDLIGGQATGRIVKYRMVFGARMYAEVSIACAIGSDEEDTFEYSGISGSTPSIYGRVNTRVSNDFDDQFSEFDNAKKIPETEITIEPINPPGTDVLQEVTVKISGDISIPKQIEFQQ